MTGPQVPIQTEPMVDDKKIVTLPWQAFFEAVAGGDPGNDWKPTFQGLTFTGPDPTLTGTYYFLSDKLTYFRIVVTPSAGNTTSAVAGTTYCDNYPLNIGNDGLAATIGGSGAAIAAVTAGTARIYTGTWTTAAVPITICGIIELR